MLRKIEQKWWLMLNNLENKLGVLESYSLKGFHITKEVGLSGPRTTAVLEYEVTYTKHTAREIISLMKRPGGQFRIFKIQINSNGFPQE